MRTGVGKALLHPQLALLLFHLGAVPASFILHQQQQTDYSKLSDSVTGFSALQPHTRSSFGSQRHKALAQKHSLGRMLPYPSLCGSGYKRAAVEPLESQLQCTSDMSFACEALFLYLGFFTHPLYRCLPRFMMPGEHGLFSGSKPGIHFTLHYPLPEKWTVILLAVLHSPVCFSFQHCSLQHSFTHHSRLKERDCAFQINVILCIPYALHCCHSPYKERGLVATRAWCPSW